MTSFAALIAPVTAPLNTAPAVSASAALGHRGSETDSELFSALVTEAAGQTAQPELAGQSAPSATPDDQSQSTQPEVGTESAALLSPLMATQVQTTSALTVTPHAASPADETSSSEEEHPATELNAETSGQVRQSPPQPAQPLTTAPPASASATSATEEADAPHLATGQDRAAAQASLGQDRVGTASATSTPAGADQNPTSRSEPLAVVPAPIAPAQGQKARAAESAAALQGLLSETAQSEGTSLEGSATSVTQPPAATAQTGASGLSPLPLPLRNGPASHTAASPQGQISDADAEGQTMASQGPLAETSGSKSEAGQKGLARTEAPTSLATSLQAQLESGKTLTATAPEQAALDPALDTESQSGLQQAHVNEPASPPASALSRTTVETTALIAAQILKKLDSRSTRFDMALTPESLGRVDVSMEIDADGQVTARLAFDNPAAAAELRGRVDELRRQLQDAGLQLREDSFEFTDRNPSSGFGGGAFDRQPQHRAFAGAARLRDQADSLSSALPAQWTPLNLTPDRVDLKV